MNVCSRWIICQHWNWVVRAVSLLRLLPTSPLLTIVAPFLTWSLTLLPITTGNTPPPCSIFIQTFLQWSIQFTPFADDRLTDSSTNHCSSTFIVCGGCPQLFLLFVSYLAFKNILCFPFVQVCLGKYILFSMRLKKEKTDIQCLETHQVLYVSISVAERKWGWTERRY